MGGGEETYAGNTQILNGGYSVSCKRGANPDAVALSTLAFDMVLREINVQYLLFSKTHLGGLSHAP